METHGAMRTPANVAIVVAPSFPSRLNVQDVAPGAGRIAAPSIRLPTMAVITCSRIVREVATEFGSHFERDLK